MVKLKLLDALKVARSMKCKVRRPSKNFVDIVCNKHGITIGRENGKYFLNTTYSGKLIWNKRHLTKKKMETFTFKALAGFDLGEILKKRLR